jgi:D-inositol-3-phosphate glycosyltransferase
MRHTVFVAGDFPTGNTGLGTVMGEGILPALAGHDVHVMGVNYRGDPHPFEGVKAYPAGAYGSQLGMNRIRPLVEEIRPDVVFLFGDLPVIKEWVKLTSETVFRSGAKFVCYYPVDSHHIRLEDLLCVKEMTAHATYTQFAKAEVEKECARWSQSSDTPLTLSPPAVVGHGVNTDVFYPLETMKARNALRLDGITEETVIVLNANRNQPRKRIDLTILAYVEALRILSDMGRGDVDLRLYLHMAVKGEGGVGWNCLTALYDAMRDAGFSQQQMQEKAYLLFTSVDMTSLSTPPAQVLNLVYNACDIGINTAEAEGWGLVTHEHAATGAPQITTRYASLEELWHDVAPNLSLWPSTIGIHRETCTKRVAVDHVAAGYMIAALAADKETRMSTGKKFYQKAVSMQWDSVRAGIKELVDAALPQMRRGGRRERKASE